MAEYADRYRELQAAGADVAALSVDGPDHSEAVRRRYRLPFPILCDTDREVIARWDLYNRAEKGGVARAAVFVLDRDRRVRFVSVDGTATRMRAAEMLEFVRAGGRPRRRVILPTLREWLGTAGPALRLTLFPPKRGPR